MELQAKKSHLIFLIFLSQFFQYSFQASSLRTEYATMRDGSKLAVDVYTPEDSTNSPVILEMTPYRRAGSYSFSNEADFWTSQGYILIVADCRGTGDSEGEFEFFAREGEDGYDLIDWISKQPWSNGKVGMRGSSYSGTNQIFIAAKQPKNLKCITPSATFGRPMEHPPFNSGFTTSWALSWIGKSVNLKNNSIPWVNQDPTKWLAHRPLYTLDVFVTGRVLPLYRKFLEHPTLDSFWDKIVMKPSDYANINIPSLSFTGWYDGTMYGTIMRYKYTNKYSPRKNDHFLIVGPYTHLNAPDGGYDVFKGEFTRQLGDVRLEDNAFIPGLNMTREFFDWCLKNGTRPNWDQTRVYITGSNKWDKSYDFLKDDLEDKYLYFSSQSGSNSLNGDGRIALTPTRGSDSFEYDPEKPVRSDLLDTGLPIDMNLYLNRSDFLVYTSDVLKQPLTIFDEVFIELSFSSTVKDTDFVVFLLDVTENGKSIKLGSLATSQKSTRHRDGFDKEVLMEPNKIYDISINLHEIGHTFLTGHRIRVAVTSSFYPLLAANPNTGNSFAFDTDKPVKSKQTIYYGDEQGEIKTRVKFKSRDNLEKCFR